MKLIIKLGLMVWFTAIAGISQAQEKYTRYQTKVVLMSFKSIKGQLEKATEEGVTITDSRGNYHFFKAAEIHKVKVRKKGLTIGHFVAGGTGAGMALGYGLTKDNVASGAGDIILATAAMGAAGALVGTLLGVGAEAINNRVIILSNGDEAFYKGRYKKLQRYARETAPKDPEVSP